MSEHNKGQSWEPDDTPSAATWEVVYTRKVNAGTASDGANVDSGITLDSNYEYVVGVWGPAHDAVAPTAPVISGHLERFGGSPSLQIEYKPDGVNTLSSSDLDAVNRIPAGMVSIGSLVFNSLGGFGREAKLLADRKFYTKWTLSASNDMHVVIARRRRYG
jgi:hypothetical protein